MCGNEKQYAYVAVFQGTNASKLYNVSYLHKVSTYHKCLQLSHIVCFTHFFICLSISYHNYLVCKFTSYFYWMQKKSANFAYL